MPKTDEEAYEFYKNPDNLTTTGRVYEVPKGVLSRHVPIRFRPQTIAKAKAIAQRDGMTVSSWIRGVIEREVERRMPASQTRRSQTDATTWHIIRGENLTEEARTKNPGWTPNSDQIAFA
jgi:hypothetical protein